VHLNLHHLKKGRSMRKVFLCLICLFLLLSACTPTIDQTSTPAADTTEAALTETEQAWPPVVGPDPSPRVAAFYYPWYFNEEFDGRWDHWGRNPPQDIASDYYPLLGTYSMSDPAVLAQHFAWLRQSGVGLIISSWWGRNDPTDNALPLILDVADYYGIKVAIHIEPYDGRSAERLILDINYLLAQYGDYPAFYWTNETSCFNSGEQPKGLFFLWNSMAPENGTGPVDPDYWLEAMDSLHSQEPGVVVLTDQANNRWVTSGHFDGAYSYVVLDIDEVGYDWAAAIPACAWYVPGINPGISAIQIQYEDEVNTPRRDGQTYDNRWERMFATGVEPTLVAISTFNEWHEGTQIEPAAVGMTRSNGQPYLDFSPLDPEAYLDMTNDWAQVFLNYEWPEGFPLRVSARTTSDWSSISLVSGATWRSPTVISASQEPGEAGMYDGIIGLNQPLDNAQAGNQVEAVFELEFVPGDTQEPVVFAINRGNIGATWLELYRLDGQEWVLVDAFTWAGIIQGPSNSVEFSVDYASLFEPD
jgi:hypothetical protein